MGRGLRVRKPRKAGQQIEGFLEPNKSESAIKSVVCIQILKFSPVGLAVWLFCYRSPGGPGMAPGHIKRGFGFVDVVRYEAHYGINLIRLPLQRSYEESIYLRHYIGK